MTYLKAMGQGHILRYFKGTQFGGGGAPSPQQLANLANLIQLALTIDAHGISGVFG